MPNGPNTQKVNDWVIGLAVVSTCLLLIIGVLLTGLIVYFIHHRRPRFKQENNCTCGCCCKSESDEDRIIWPDEIHPEKPTSNWYHTYHQTKAYEDLPTRSKTLCYQMNQSGINVEEPEFHSPDESYQPEASVFAIHVPHGTSREPSEAYNCPGLETPTVCEVSNPFFNPDLVPEDPPVNEDNLP
ncbi:hypothetical protein P879_04505 [Paragonimus westermani]|uniref:Uncharacterized protein n=1 Tax=Paragonimus westermani TaxID=34504 RepID=A0A8T0D9A9_9TREM|nr:hypothetical protein P879_04505 [Paragonimus westermani]